jgi:hypothetical protein
MTNKNIEYIVVTTSSSLGNAPMQSPPLVSLVIVLLSAIPAMGGIAIDVLVPAYANPCCGGGPNMWTSLTASARDADRNYQLHAIFNPASGPGVRRDPNYVTATGNGPLKDFRDAGGITHGYVATTYADRPLDQVKADVDAYLTGHYAGLVDGIFFDEMSNDLADVGYYRELQSYVKAIKPDARTFGNPGTTFVNNPSRQSAFSTNDFVQSLDTIMTFENDSSSYQRSYRSFPHLQGLDRHQLAHIVHTHDDWDASLLDLAATRGAGFLYVTDDRMGNDNNPYNTLTSDWNSFTADVTKHNAKLIPEPSSGALTASAALLLLAAFRRQLGTTVSRTHGRATARWDGPKPRRQPVKGKSPSQQAVQK